MSLNTVSNAMYINIWIIKLMNVNSKHLSIAYQIRLKIALPSLHSKNKLKATSFHPNLSNV